MAASGAAAAPEAARLIRDFVNTAEPQTAGELFVDAAALARWLSEHDLLVPGGTLTPEDLRLALTVREGLRAVLQGHAGDAGHGARDAQAELGAALAGISLRASFDPAGVLRLSAVDERPVSVAVGRLLDAVRRSAVEGSWDRLKVCARDSCRWAFYDASRNRSGRWCSMAGCGNQAKMQRAHARRRDGARQADDGAERSGAATPR